MCEVSGYVTSSRWLAEIFSEKWQDGTSRAKVVFTGIDIVVQGCQEQCEAGGWQDWA